MYAYNFICKQKAEKKSQIFNIIFTIGGFYGNMTANCYKRVTKCFALCAPVG